MNKLLPVAEAQARLLGLTQPMPVEKLAIGNATGRWLARDLKALRTQPPSDLSAMDGYAIRYGDLPGPWRVIGESAAGKPFGMAVHRGEAVRIFTGAAMPESANTVFVQEEAESDGNVVRLIGEEPARKGAHVRKEGEDFARSDILLKAGERLDAAQIALAVTGGHGEASVRNRPVVSIISTGDELAMPGTVNKQKIPASNATNADCAARALAR